MPDKHYEAKKRWNTANYKQLNISVRPELAESFRLACEQTGFPMREILITFMAGYSKTPITPNKKHEANYTDRRSRRKAIKNIINRLEKILDAEEQYMMNIPENLSTSSRYESAEQAVEIMGEIIERLHDVYP